MGESVVVWSRVSKEVRRLAEEVAKSKGISFSEYIRSLVLGDLDRRGIFTNKLKENLEGKIHERTPEACQD